MACPHARLRHSRFVHTESRTASLVFQAFALLYMDTGVSLIYYVLDILSVKMVSHHQPTRILGISLQILHFLQGIVFFKF
jgi:K+ transporter